MASSNNILITSVKILLMSTGVVFIAILLTLSLPPVFASATSELPSIMATLRSWLRPPYLYFIINGIIISIVATSRLHTQHHAPPQESATYAPHAAKALPGQLHDVISVRADQFSPYGAVLGKDVHVDSVVGVEYYGDVSVKDVGVVEVEEVKRVPMKAVKVEEYDDESAAAAVSERVDATVVERSMWNPPSARPSPLMRQAALETLPEFYSERPPASSRFGHHRRPIKASPAEGGKALRRVAKPKKQDTLESTWKAITEGRHIPLTRHLKKSDTWENPERHQINLLDSPLLPEVKKSQTFKDRTNLSQPLKIKKEPSLGQDELNRRVEAFINKFNDEMRLQRQQSVQQFMEMINRAA